MARQSTSQKKAQTDATSDGVIIITAQKDGYRRCDVAHRATPTEHPIDRFTSEELEHLQADPRLVVQIEGERSTS